MTSARLVRGVTFLWQMKLNTSKTTTMIVSRSRTMHPQSPVLTIDGTVLNESDDLDILGRTFESKIIFSRSAFEWLGIFKKSWRVFNHRLAL